MNKTDGWHIMPKPAFYFTPILNQLALFDNHIPCFLPETEKHFNYACDISHCLLAPQYLLQKAGNLKICLLWIKIHMIFIAKKQCLMAWHGKSSLAQAVQLEGLGKAKNW